MKKYINYIILLSLFFGGISLLSSCADDDEILIPKYTPKPIAPVNPDENPRGDESFASFNKAFLVTKDGLQYYRITLSSDEKDYFWGQALDIQMVEDVYWRTKSSTHASLIKNLLNTFIIHNKGSNPNSEWAWNDFNDDILWAGLAFARGYQITNEAVFLEKAEYAFNLMYNRGWDTQLGGGIWWRQTPDNEDERAKSALSNSPAIVLGCYLYEFTENTDYLNKSIAIGTWTMQTLFRSDNGGVYENIKATSDLSDYGNVYTNGTFVEAMNYLHRITGENKYYDAAEKATDFVRTYRTTNDIISRSWRGGTWQSEYLRGAGNFVRENNLWGTYYDWFRKNANAAWNAQRTDLGITWNDWVNTTEEDNKMSVLESVGGVIVQQIAPIQSPELFAGRGYALVYKADTTKVLVYDNGLSVMDRSSGLFSNNQKFKIIPAGYGYYQLESVSSPGKVLTANGVNVSFESESGAASQYWKLFFDNRNCYKLKPKNDTFKSLAYQDSQLVLRKDKHTDEERWIFEE